MSTRMPPRGGAPQRPPYRPPASVKNSKPAAERGERRRVFDIVILLVVIALAAVLARQLGGGPSSTANAGATQNASGKTPKPGNTAAASGTALPSGDQPRITELMASNKGSITDGKGEYGDWIEIYNPTNRAINLAGFALSDNVKKPTKFVMPFYMLDPGKYMIVYADGKESTGKEIHANFKLKNSSQQLLMTDPGGNVMQQVLYPALQENFSYAMDMGTNQWATVEKYTPGFSNDDGGYTAYQQTRHVTEPAAINEVMAGNTLTLKDEDGEYSDWVEIRNTSEKALDLTGWGLSNSEATPKRWVFPKTKIEPGQYVVVFCSGKNRAVEGKELHTDFRLNAFKETVLLSNLLGQIVNGSEVQINRQKDDESYGRVPGSDAWQAYAHPTPGYANDEGGWNEFQKTLYANTGNAPVIISEVMSNNTTLKDQDGDYPDWIELYNRSNGGVDLKGWGLTDKSGELGRWQFPEITLGAGKYITVFASGKNLTDSDAVSKKKLHTDFNIGTGGILALTSPDGAVADRCFVPLLRSGLTYDRPAGSMLFGYSTSPTPGAANAGGEYPGMAPDPAFSVKAGMYDTEQSVALTASDPEAKIYYTLYKNGENINTTYELKGSGDGEYGCKPVEEHKLYTGPIKVEKPNGKQFGATVIQAVALKDGYLPSNVVTNTYIIGQDLDLPVLSITVDYDDMFNPTTGLYRLGPHPGEFPYSGANFNKHGDGSEIPAHVELFDPDNPEKLVVISQDAGLQIFGAYSRADVFKGLDLVARNEYGKNSFDYPVFPDQPDITSYKHLVSRPGGQDVRRTGMRDVLVGSLARDTIPVDGAVGGPQVYVQDYRTVLEFVNGEFWGVTQIRDLTDEETISKHYHVDPTSVAILERDTFVKAGTTQDAKDFTNLVNYAKNHDMNNPGDYKYVTDRMDIDSYINWFTLELCSGNSDTANIRMWRSSELDNKWRWIFYDFCWTYADNDRSDIYRDIDKAKAGTNGALVQALLKRPDFKDKFLKQLAYNINVTYSTDAALQRIDEFQKAMQPYMAAEYEKWSDISYLAVYYGHVNGYGNWGGQVDTLRDFARKDPQRLKQEMKTYFNLSDAEMKKLFPNG